MNSPTLLQFVLFAAAWFFGLYAVGCLIKGRLRKLDIRQALLHVAALAVLGMIAEICIGNFYEWVFDKPLWHYHILPIHGAYTSLFAPVVWGIYGFYLYMFHPHLYKTRSLYGRYMLILFCLEGIALEGLVNVTFRVLTGSYIYYYFPVDLLHYSSLQTIPFSFMGKYVISFVLQTFKAYPVIFVGGSLGAILLLALL